MVKQDSNLKLVEKNAGPESGEPLVLSILVVDDVLIGEYFVRKKFEADSADGKVVNIPQNIHYFDEDVFSGLRASGFKRVAIDEEIGGEIDDDANDLYGIEGKKECARLRVYEKQENGVTLRVLLTSHHRVAHRIIKKYEPEEKLFEVLPANKVLYQKLLVGAFVDHSLMSAKKLHDNVFYPEIQPSIKIPEYRKIGWDKKAENLEKIENEMSHQARKKGRAIAKMLLERVETKIVSICESGDLVRKLAEDEVKKDKDFSGFTEREKEIKIAACVGAFENRMIEFDFSAAKFYGETSGARKNGLKRVEEMNLLFREALSIVRGGYKNSSDRPLRVRAVRADVPANQV